jgi:hypothetical protein
MSGGPTGVRPRLKAIKNKERALRQAGAPPLPRRDDGAYLWQDRNCSRQAALIQAHKQRWKLEPDETTADKIDGWAISQAAKERGFGRQPKSAGWRLKIAEAHVLLGGSAKPIQICPLCELWCEKGRMQRGRQWHDDCWKTWKSFRSHVDNPPRLPPPMTRGRRAGAHGTRDYKWFLLQTLKGIETLRKGLRRRVRSKSNTRGSLLRKALKRGQFSPYSGRRLKALARAGVNRAAARFVRRIPGSWDALFVATHWTWQSGSHRRDHQRKRDTRNAILQKHIPLPAILSEIIASGARDPLIVRLHGFGMEVDRIVRLTGAPLERVERVIAAASLHRGRRRPIPQKARIGRLLGLGMKPEHVRLLVRCSLADVESVRRFLPQTA